MGAKPAKSRKLNSSGLRLVGIGLGLIVALGGLTVSIVLATPDVEDSLARFWPLAFAGFPIMGALVLGRRPGNRIGLIMLWIGIAAGVPQALTAASVTVTDPRLSAILERIGNSIPIDWMLVIVLLVVFPTGSISERPLKWLVRFLFVLIPFMIGFSIVSDLPLPASGRQNPLAIPALTAWSKAALDGFVIVPLSALVALVSVVRRWRRASGTDRLQYRWFAAGIGALLIGVLWITLPDLFLQNLEATDFVEKLFANAAVAAVVLGVNAVPVAIAIAVLRYRLFEIDRLVSRTVSYTVVIALLAILYTATIYGVQALVGAESELAVAGSTLVAAAAFNPVRRRVQAVVERRFNRARFDAEAEASAFADRLHRALDLNAVIADLEGVLSQTVKPARSGIWIRG